MSTPNSAPAFAGGYERLWRMADGGWMLCYEAPGIAQGWTMRLEGGGGRIDVERTADVPFDDLLQVVQTAGLSAALQLAGTVVLHGCAIELGGLAIILLGPSGVGKSTAAAAFAATGRALLSDDIAAIDIIDGKPVVHAGLTQLRVTPSTAHAVGWDPQRLPRVFDTEILGHKRRVQLSEAAGSFRPEARRIAGIYILQDRGASERRDLPEVTNLTPREVVPVLLANCYRMDMLDHPRRAHLLASLARMAQDIPVRRVKAVDDLASLPLLLEALTADEAGGQDRRHAPGFADGRSPVVRHL